MSLCPSLRSRFQGCLVGAVVGDCIGAPFEVTGVEGGPGSHKPVLEFVGKFGSEIKSPGELEYTDDTAMARCVADSLIAHDGTLRPKDLARRFAAEFHDSPTRGYGENVVTVLRALGDPDIPDVFEPARCQFDGGGSYGNGGAMRVAPVALCGKDFDKVIQNAKTSAVLTHSNKLGFNGAVVQALAVHQALHTARDDMTGETFAESLMALVEGRVECQSPADGAGNVEKRPSVARQVKKRKLQSGDVYWQRLESMRNFLKNGASPKEVASVLGNRISAHNSVVTAVYSFLRCLSPVEGLPTENPLVRTVLYAVSLDGDTDTIASMAGAIAGAFHGVGAVPDRWRMLCEGCDTALRQADRLYEIHARAAEGK